MLQFSNIMGCGATSRSTLQLSAITINHIYERKQLIGKGTYGEVYRCINKLNGLQYALKVVQIKAKNKDEAIKQINDLKRQISVLKKLDHQNIVKYYSFDIAEDEKHVQIVLQYAQKGSLKEYITSKGPLQQEQASRMTKQILKGLIYMHEKNIVHRDLKCANILMMQDGCLKITDFGTAKRMNISSTQDIAKLCKSLKGTPYFMAPQVLKRTGHNASADIWSLGCLVIEMLTGKAPWTSLTNNFEEIISYIASGIRPPFPNNLSQECSFFLQSCTDNVASQRLTALQLTKHRWIDKQLDMISEKNNKTAIARAKQQKKLLQSMQNAQIVKSLRDEKYRQFDKYMNQRKISTNMKGTQKNRISAKSKKKQNIKGVKISQQIIRFDDDDIQVVPHNPYESNKNVPQKTKKIQDDTGGLRIVKTAPFVKTPVQFLFNQDQDQIQQTQIPIVDRFKRPSLATQSKDNTRVKTDHSGQQIYIDTLISRQERNRYMQRQKQIKQQRQEEKRKWEKQLQEGANYLRKQLTKGYNI